MRILVLPLLLLSLACAHSGSINATTGKATDASTDDFDVTVKQANIPTVMRHQNDADIEFEIAVKNQTQEPYTVKRITLQSLGGPSYEVPVSSREFDRTIAPGAEEKFSYWARATVNEIGTARRPVTLRTSLELSTNGQTRNEVFTARVNGRVQLLIGRARRNPTFGNLDRTFDWIYNLDWNPTPDHSAYGLPW